MVDVPAMADEVVQRCKDSVMQQMSVPLRDCVPSAVVKAIFDASKSEAETLIGRLTKQLETERTGRANTEAQLGPGDKTYWDPVLRPVGIWGGDLLEAGDENCWDLASRPVGPEVTPRS